MASIRPLPEAVRSSIRSGISLFDLTRIVEELVYNSLDARATKVSVFVNIGISFLKVVDDGCGITRDGLELVGERYATSKFLDFADLNATSETFGFRGEALASISEVSLLEIATKAHGRPNGYRKVVKGCKCLHLGIDDDRKEVGTTVSVCELFYNHPVRRKYMQSSPSKVLQSIKKCIMRLALVCPHISFKVVDSERENVLCCTHSASSPLSLVTSGFGLEVTSSLHELLKVENDVIKLSGYISGPCNTSDMKALQFLYINSQFVCKGPIHKLLNELAVQFEHLNSWNTNKECQNKKRNRSEPCPAYLLNLRCPRSLYVLSFETSKTFVEFKDWAPILNFIEKAIKHFWEGSIVRGDSSNQATCMVQQDQLEKVDADTNTISVEGDISKFKTQHRKDCLDLFFSTSGKKTEDDYPQCNREDVRASLGYLHQGTEMFKEQQSEGNLLCQTGFSCNLLDVSYFRDMPPIMRKNNFFLMYDDNDLLQGDYFSDGKCPAAAMSSSSGRKLNEVDTGVVGESFEGDFLYDCHGLGYNVEIGGDVQKPFLKSCSTQKRSILWEKALLVNDEHELQTDNLRSKQNLGEDCSSGEDLFARPCVEVGKKLKISKDSDFLLREWPEEICLPSDSWYSATQIGNSGSDDQLSNGEWYPGNQQSSSQDIAIGVYRTDDVNDLGGGSRCYRRIYHSQYFDDEENGRNVSYDLLRNANQHHCTSGSDYQLSNCEWYPGYQQSSSQDIAIGVYHTDDINDLEGESRCYKRIYRSQIFDDEENGHNFSYDLLRNANQHHRTSSLANSGSNSGFNFDGDFDCNETFDRLVGWPDFGDTYFTTRLDILNEERDWLLPESCVRNCKRPNINKGKRDHFRYPTLENDNVRSKRSFSAPPFHRRKKRFCSLNQPQETIVKSPTGQASHPASKLLEASDFRYSQHPPGALHPSSEYLMPKNKTSVKQSIQVPGDTLVNDITEIGGFENSNAQHNDPFTELISSEVQDSMDHRTKWRNCSPQIPKNDKPVGIPSPNNILDISSGILHLAGDSLIPEAISKKCLEDAKVLQQVDKKFIPIVAGRILAVIDQHAADERIRLEELRQKVLSGESKAITYLDAEKELVLPEIGYQLLHSYSEQIKGWGWICNIHVQNSESFRRNLDVLNRKQTTITLIAVPCILGVNLNDVDLLEFLQQLADTDGSSTMPPSVIRVLNSKACRGAIMFGDPLLRSECSLIVEELKQTSLCFQCAHGRPTVAPLVNLEALHNQITKLLLMKECSNSKWHGLQRRKICIERTAQRLSSARES